jgi:hypothetical protein
MVRMIAKLKLDFSWHALPLTFVRKSAPEMGMERIRSRNGNCRNPFGIVSEHHPISIRMSSDLFMSLSRFPTEPSLEEI